MLSPSKVHNDDPEECITYRSGVATEEQDALTSINGDVKSYASSKVEIELEFLAKRVEQERLKKRKLIVKASQVAQLMADKELMEVQDEYRNAREKARKD
jgi:hypothetical protein